MAELPVACPAMRTVTIGSPGLMSKAMLVCDEWTGHESLHHDTQDGIWWRSDDDEQDRDEI